MEIPKTIQIIKKLRNGEKVACEQCHNGIIEPIGDYKTTKGFRCNNCDNAIYIN